MATDSEPSARPPHTHFETINIWGNARVHNGPNISQPSVKPDDERAAVLNWLSPLRSAETHNEIRKKAPVYRADRPNSSGDWTGKWLIESDIFKDWEERKISRLWYYGMPSQFPVYIALDALDEYHGSANCEDGSVFKRLLNHLVPDAAEEGSISIVITSRLLDDFNGLSKGVHQVKIVAHHRDVAIFVDHEFNNNSRLQRYSRRDPRLQNLVEKTVIRTCGGMFLLARLHMEALRNQLTEADLYEKLRTLPDGIDSTYDMIMERLRELPTEEKRFLVWNSLAWIVLSRRRLQTAELQHALACTKGAQKLDSRQFYDLEDVEELCGGLIEYTNSTVVLVHYTAQSYLDTRAKQLFAGFHDVIAQACFRYIGFFSLGAVPAQKRVVTVATTDYVARSQYCGIEEDADFIPSQMPVDDVFGSFPFLGYAILHSRYHVNQQVTYRAPQTLDMLDELLNDQEKRDFLYFLLQRLGLYPAQTTKQLSHPTQLPKRSLVFTRSDPVSTTSNTEGDESILTETHEENVSGRETEQVGSNIRLQRSIAGLDIEAWLEPFMKGFVLNIEPEKQHEYLPIKVIIWSIMAKIDKCNRELRQSRSGLAREDTTKVISQAGGAWSQAAPRAWYIRGDADRTYSDTLEHESALPETKDRSTCSPLHLAVCLGWTQLVDYIARSSDDVNTVDSSGLTPLWIAILKRNFEAAEILLSHHDALVDLCTLEGITILIYLAVNQRSDLVRRILSRASSTLLFQPVLLVFGVFSSVIAKMLLLLLGVRFHWRAWEPQAVTHQTHLQFYDLQLLASAHKGDLSTIRNFIDSGKVDIEPAGQVAVTAIFLATALRQVDVVEYLLHYGIDIDSPGPHGMTLLHLATSLGDAAMVKMLLARGADASAKDDNGRPAWMASLHVANRKGLMKIFIEAGISLDTFEPDDGTWTLYSAACTGNIELVRLILESGGNPSQQTSFGWTPLHFAADMGNLDCVIALLEANAEISPMSDVLKTPLDMAIQGKQAYIAKLLRHAGAKTREELHVEQNKLETTRTIETPLDEFDLESGSDPEQPQDTPRLVDSFLLLVRNWRNISFEDDQMAQDIRAYLRREISEVLADYIVIDYRELGRITAEDITSWDELISEI
ncbi:unnamed protein product [Alternaria alternata]